MHSESMAMDVPPENRPADMAIRQRVLRKNAWRLLPLLTLAFIFNYIDRTSVGFAALTMNKDIGLTPMQFGWGAGVLFAGYCLCEIPSNLALYRYGARRWLTRIMITWGLASAATAFVQGPTSFFVLRLLLGVAEAGFFPGVTFFLACWFPAQYRVRVLAFFMLGVPVSSIIGGPMSALLLEMNGIAGLHGWQWMFLIQGLPAVLIGFAVYALLRDDPNDAHWLTDDERTELVRMLSEEPRRKPTTALFAALKDGRVLLLAATQFGFILGSYGVGIWLPLILRGHGFSVVNVGLFSTVPYIAAVIGMLIWARAVDRSGRRVFHLVASCAVGAAGLALSACANGIVVEMIGLSLAVVAVSSARAIFWTIPTRFLTGVAAAGGLAFINSLGTLGGFAGPYLVGFLKQTTGTFSAGIWAMAAILGVSAALAATLPVLARQE
ncbi:sugar phosphate permease [Trinickia symbiotica]|uniref:MFS transporter n=1 Tax=Trinickia symbiotica TaxID=863227 RepID=A0A2N7X585_9BURK|nr:MFS transporter [Trinickia symbiotica]PMS36784.1 MFS transporter [Trinickia symbiotica]PPK46233.1 sugar phosphate permease [Trinickia symbiotica]